MKTDSPRSAPPQPEDLAVLPRKRKWFGYTAVAVSLAITYALLLAAMGAADEWYGDPWKYPAKVGSHGTLIAHYSDEAAYVDRAYLESVVEQPFLDCLFLVCGPPPLMAAIRTLLADAGVSARQVTVEDFEIR